MRAAFFSDLNGNGHERNSMATENLDPVIPGFEPERIALYSYAHY